MGTFYLLCRSNMAAVDYYSSDYLRHAYVMCHESLNENYFYYNLHGSNTVSIEFKCDWQTYKRLLKHQPLQWGRGVGVGRQTGHKKQQQTICFAFQDKFIIIYMS